eukprot:362394-Chlamydomonas_euryale.AAC.1
MKRTGWCLGLTLGRAGGRGSQVSARCAVCRAPLRRVRRPQRPAPAAAAPPTGGRRAQSQRHQRRCRS